MADRLSHSQVFKRLLAGPGTSPPPTANQVALAGARHPRQLANVLRKIFSAMASEVLRFPGRDAIGKWLTFSNHWRGTLSTDEARFYFASVDAYERATKVGLRELDWRSTDLSRIAARRMRKDLPESGSIEGLAWRTLLGQIESIHSRDEAAETFLQVREHSRAHLLTEFSRDTGALTYYSESEVFQRRRNLPSLREMRSEDHSAGPKSRQAILISTDSDFFRIYAPMLLHNAQQLPTVDFVILLCAPPHESQILREDAEVFLSGLARLNRQPTPTNLRLNTVSTPDWISNEITFYAVARFLAIPDLLEQYSLVYAMDADLFLLRDPRPFMDKLESTPFATPLTKGSLGVSPWRRYMAGNVIASQEYLESVVLDRFHDYLSVGLTEENSWMLDQNGLAYAIESLDNYSPLGARPASVGSFMGQWEKNFRASLDNSETPDSV